MEKGWRNMRKKAYGKQQQQKGKIDYSNRVL
jgi:hypothetical protein